MDVTKIFLTTAEQQAFDKFSGDNETAVLTYDEFALLRNKGLVKDQMDGASGWFDALPEQGMCQLTDAGKSLHAYQIAEAKSKRTEALRYRITTGIALVALIKSFWPELSAAVAKLLMLLGQ